MQHIPRSPLFVGDVDFADIDAWCIHFANHVLKGVLLGIPPHSCVDDYLYWFKQVSHPYIISCNHDDQPTLVPRLRWHVRNGFPS